MAYEDYVVKGISSMSIEEIQRKVKLLESRLEGNVSSFKLAANATKQLLKIYGEELFERLLLEDEDGI